MYWASWGVCWINPKFGHCSLFFFLVELRTYQHPLVFLSSGRQWNSSHCKSFSALSLNMISRNLILTAIHGTKTRASQLAVYCNSSDRCIVCRHAKRSECWVTSLYMSHLIWNRLWQQAAGLGLAGTLNLHRRFFSWLGSPHVTAGAEVRFFFFGSSRVLDGWWTCYRKHSEFVPNAPLVCWNWTV